MTLEENAPQEGYAVQHPEPTRRPTLTELTICIHRELDAIDAVLDKKDKEMLKDKGLRVDGLSLENRLDDLQGAMQIIIGRIKELHARLQSTQARL